MSRFKLKRNRLRKRLGELIFEAAERYRDSGYQTPDTKIEEDIVSLMRGSNRHSFRFHYDRPRRNKAGNVFHIVIPDLDQKTRTDDDFAKEAMSHVVLYGCSQ
jgi:hypothetical protein